VKEINLCRKKTKRASPPLLYLELTYMYVCDEKVEGKDGFKVMLGQGVIDTRWPEA
jgi:hypothetical protein